MKRYLTALFAVALSICCLAGSYGAATAAPANNPYAQEYVRVLDQIKHQFFYPEFFRPDQWSKVEQLADGITNQAQLESALYQVRVRIHPDIRLLDQSASDELRAHMEPGFVGFGITIGVVTLIGPSGVVVTTVEEGSTAEDADLRVGDAIIAVDGQPVANQPEGKVRLRIGLVGTAGATTVFTVERAGVRKTIAVKHDLDGGLGMDFDVKNPVVYPDVEYVRPDSPAERAGVLKNDRILSVNGTDTVQVSPTNVVSLLTGFLGGHVSMVTERDGQAKTVELTRGIVSDWGLALGFGSQGGGGEYGAKDPRYNYTHFEVKNLDWHGGVAQAVADDLSGQLNDEPALVLDLSGATGNDAESAARIAAHFMSDGTLIWVTLPGGQSVRYFMQAGDLIKETVTASLKTQETLSKSVKQFTGKLAILVDGQTGGVAMAIAQSLQANKRGVVVGTGTMSDAVLNGVIDVTTPDKHLLLVLPTHALLAADGTQFHRVVPDSVALIDAKDSALRTLAGTTWLSEPENTAFLIVFSVVIVIFGGIFLWARNEKNVDGSQSGAPVPPVETQVEAKPVELPAKPAKSKRVTTRLGIFLRVAVFALMCLALLAFIKGVSRLAGGPPVGGHSVVLVLSIVDGSQQSDVARQQIAEVEKEISGNVTFDTVDVRQHPEYLSYNPHAVRFATNAAPMIWVLTVTYDKNGKEYSRGGSGMGGPYGLTRRSILREIRFAAAGNNQNFVVPVQRVKPVAH